MAFSIKTSEEKKKERLEKDKETLRRLQEDRRQRLINPFEPEKFKVRGSSFLYDPTDYPRLAKSLPEMRQLLEQMENELQVELKKADSHQIKVDKIKTDIAQTDFGAVELAVSEALKWPLYNIECTEFSLEIGGEIYIGLTQTTIESSINDLLRCADHGAMDRVSIQLRRFGNVHKSNVIDKHQNEIYGLVGQFTSINKYSASLNEPFPDMGLETGLETQNYRLIEKSNSFNEKVLAIVSIKNQEMKVRGSFDEIELSRLRKNIQKIEGEICEIKNSIGKLEPYETPELNDD